MFGALNLADEFRRQRESVGRLYVTVMVDGETTWFMAGPFLTRAEADEQVAPAKRLMMDVDFYFRCFYYRFTSCAVHYRERLWVVPKFPELGQPLAYLPLSYWERVPVKAKRKRAKP